MPIRLFKVGADPEFGFMSNDEIVCADNVITPRRRFGLDGCEYIAELRPIPSINPSQVVRNIYQDMIEGYYSNPSTRSLYWKAGNSIPDSNEGPFAIGGHVHLGLAGVVRGNRQVIYNQVTNYLDTYLYQVVSLLEDKDEVSERNDNEYGNLGDVRVNGHGLEYRTLGSWLTSPRVAEGVLCLAQTATYQCLVDRSGNKINKADRLNPRADCECSILDEGGCTCTERETVHYRKVYPEVKSRIRRMKLYKKHEVPIEFLFALVDKQKTWFPGKEVDMKTAWGISGRPHADVKPTKILPAVKLEDIWKRAN